ncbi:MAG: NRDE family protein, partial [Candidatus Rokuibacteriota bacterium]
MCLLALWVGRAPDAPLIAAANRDEFFGRPAAAPAEIEPGIVAGKDLLAGGTWLGVSRHGLFVAVTNRPEPARTAASYSRGLLALEALRCPTLERVETLVAERTAAGPLAGFNLVAVRDGAGVCLHWDGALRPVRFGPGLHV